MRMRKKPNLIPRMERCSAVNIKNPESFKGSWLKEISGFNDLELEIGCGKGRFTAGVAVTMQNTLLVALEKVPDAMVMAMEKVCAAEIKNVRFISSDAALLEEYFAPSEVSVIYINFCDPWPSNRHAKRRLTAPGFLDVYKNILKPGGEIRFKTDNLPLFEYSLEQFKENGFELSDVTFDLHENGPVGIMTDYEAKFYEQGLKINRCVAKYVG